MIALGLNASTVISARVVSWPERALMRSVARRGCRRRHIAHAFGRSIWTVDIHCVGIVVPRRRLGARGERMPADEERRLTSRDRREALRAAGRCICGPLVGFISARGTVHGKPVSGGRCQRCLDVHKGSN